MREYGSKKSSLLLFPISLLSLMHRRPEVPLVLFGSVNGKSNEFQACRIVSFLSVRLISVHFSYIDFRSCFVKLNVPGISGSSGFPSVDRVIRTRQRIFIDLILSFFPIPLSRGNKVGQIFVKVRIDLCVIHGIIDRYDEN